METFEFMSISGTQLLRELSLVIKQSIFRRKIEVTIKKYLALHQRAFFLMEY